MPTQDKYPPKNKVRHMRRPKKRRASPLGPLILFAIIASAVYMIARGGGERISAYDGYVLEINKLARASGEMAEDFALLQNEAFTITRSEFRSRTDENYKGSFDIYKKSASLMPPSGLEGAHAYVKLAFDLRADGTELFGPAMASVLEGDKSDEVLTKLQTALRYLVLSDEAYLRFEEEAKGLLETKGATDSVVGSDFVKENDIADSSKVLAYVSETRPALVSPPASSDSAPTTPQTTDTTVLRGVALSGLVIKPTRIAYDEATKTATLPEVAEVTAEITVENQGDQSESNLLVKATVTVSGQEIASKTATIVRLAPGEKGVVSIRGLKVEGGGSINLLKATAVPVEGERITTNNTREARLKVG